MSQVWQEVLAAEQAVIDMNASIPNTGAKRGTTLGSVSRPLVLSRSVAKHHKHFHQCIISHHSQAPHVLGMAMMNVHRLFLDKR